MKYLLIVTGLLFFSNSQAQTSSENPWLNQGQLQIGVGVGAGWGNQVRGYLRATPYAQYFLRDRWNLRVEGRYNYNGPGGDQYIGAGLLTQYHFLRTSKLSVFGQAGYFYGKADYGLYRSITDTPTSSQLESYREQFNYGMLNIGLGTQYQLTPRWSVNALVEKNIGAQTGRFGADSFNATIGVGFRLK